jgi:hypothetical protein
VDLPSLKVSAVGAAISMAVASGARGLEAAVVLTDGDIATTDLDIVREFAGTGVPVHRGSATGVVQDTLDT